MPGLQARSLSADYSMQGMYSVPLDASGYDLGGMSTRDLLYSDAFAPSQFGDVSGAGYISVRFNTCLPILVSHQPVCASEDGRCPSPNRTHF